MTEPTKAAPELLADMVGEIVTALPEGITATVILCIGDENKFEVAVAGSTPAPLLRLVLRDALTRLGRKLAQ